jgi:hypothetical protein
MKMSGGKKHDGGKPPMNLVGRIFKREVAKVLGFGAEKYDAWNWSKGMKWSRLAAAAERHLDAWVDGDNTDDETGLSHLAHAACCLMFLIEYQARGLGEDDRHKWDNERDDHPCKEWCEYESTPDYCELENDRGSNRHVGPDGDANPLDDLVDAMVKRIATETGEWFADGDFGLPVVDFLDTYRVRTGLDLDECTHTVTCERDENGAIPLQPVPTCGDTPPEGWRPTMSKPGADICAEPVGHKGAHANRSRDYVWFDSLPTPDQVNCVYLGQAELTTPGGECWPQDYTSPPYCCERGPDHYVCTLTVGHPGDHAAVERIRRDPLCGDKWRWPQQ